MNQNQILIIGSGIAGLACGQELINKQYKVVIYEANQTYGGRLKPLLDFSNKVHLEAGGQTIHHPENNYFKMAKEMGVQFEEGTGMIDSIYDPNSNSIINYYELKTKYPKLIESQNQFTLDIPLQDENVLERIKRKNYPQEFLHFFQALYGAEYGADLADIGAKSIGFYERDMPMFVSDYEISNHFHHQTIMNHLFSDAIKNIYFNKIVVAVEINDKKVMVTTLDGDKQYFDKVVCCVPITQIKKIKFNPPFSKERQEQLDLVGMSKGGKVFIKLQEAIMKYEEDYIIPKLDINSQWWIQEEENEQIILGIVGFDGYQKILTNGVQQFCQYVIDKINEQYKINLKIQKCHFENWGDQPYIEGLYSYPKVGAAENYREIISQPIDNKIYFAGEAYHKVFYQSIHGAYESGINVAKIL